jgi:hypothetical protein
MEKKIYIGYRAYILIKREIWNFNDGSFDLGRSFGKRGGFFYC